MISETSKYLAGAALCLIGAVIVQGVNHHEDPRTRQEILWEQGYDSLNVSPVEGISECGDAAGCFKTDTPSTLYVSYKAKGDFLEYVLLHELAHKQQFDEGVELDECDADARAAAMGADTRFSTLTCTHEGV